MIWRFGKKQLSDVVKVQQFLEKEAIDYELLMDHIDIKTGESALLDESVYPTSTPPVAYASASEAPTLASGTRPIDTSTVDNDPLWRVAQHGDSVCSDKAGCKDPSHYGAEPL